MQEAGGLTDTIEAEQRASEIRTKLLEAYEAVTKAGDMMVALNNDVRDGVEVSLLNEVGDFDVAAVHADQAREHIRWAGQSLMKVDWEEELKRSGI